MIIVSGPRQVGKTTMVRQALPVNSSCFVAADQPVAETIDPFNEHAGSAIIDTDLASSPLTGKWLTDQWQQARAQAVALPSGERYMLAIDEIQKIPRWSEIVKGLWDADRANEVPLHVILLGSSPWLVQKGLTESLMGRYESISMTHWSYPEMQVAFDFSLDEYIYFGGYPGSAGFIRDEPRWQSY
ncbi:MAG: AAA family ATPase, partial [Gammaproteobacteria bacterium]|nr:AAA family ATPase [Gammaproteobacteria bacterium]